MANSNRLAEFADGTESLADRQARLGIALDHAWIGWMIADLRWHLARKYSDDQPRVPAGDPDGGQWVGDNGRNKPAQVEIARTGGSGEECAAEWASAIAKCRAWLLLPNPPRGLTGGHSDPYKCARGHVSARCGGNGLA